MRSEAALPVMERDLASRSHAVPQKIRVATFGRQREGAVPAELSAGIGTLSGMVNGIRSKARGRGKGRRDLRIAIGGVAATPILRI